MITGPSWFLAAAFFPEPLLPDWLRTVAASNPAAPVIARATFTFG
jgi:hypothetical protein